MWRARSSLRAARRVAIARIESVLAGWRTVGTATALRARTRHAPVVRGPYEPRSRFSAWTVGPRLRTLWRNAGGHRVRARVLRPGGLGPRGGLPERRRREGARGRDAEVGLPGRPDDRRDDDNGAHRPKRLGGPAAGPAAQPHRGPGAA